MAEQAGVKKMRRSGLAWELCPPGVRWADACDFTEEGRQRSGVKNACARADMFNTKRGQGSLCREFAYWAAWEQWGSAES